MAFTAIAIIHSEVNSFTGMNISTSFPNPNANIIIDLYERPNIHIDLRLAENDFFFF